MAEIMAEIVEIMVEQGWGGHTTPVGSAPSPCAPQPRPTPNPSVVYTFADPTNKEAWHVQKPLGGEVEEELEGRESRSEAEKHELNRRALADLQSWTAEKQRWEQLREAWAAEREEFLSLIDDQAAAWAAETEELQHEAEKLKERIQELEWNKQGWKRAEDWFNNQLSIMELKLIEREPNPEAALFFSRARQDHT